MTRGGRLLAPYFREALTALKTPIGDRLLELLSRLLLLPDIARIAPGVQPERLQSCDGIERQRRAAGLLGRPGVGR